MALVRGTVFTPSVSLLVAVSMKNVFVAQLLPSAETSRKNMVDFYLIFIREEPSTPGASPFLFSEQPPQRSTKQIVLAESLTPIQQVAIIGARRPFDFDMSLDVGVGMIPQRSVLIGEYPAVALVHMPVLVGYPSSAFVGVSALSPLLKLQEESFTADAKGLGGCYRSVIVGPPADRGVQLFDKFPLRCMPVSLNHLSDFLGMLFDRFFAGCDDGLKAKQSTGAACFSRMGFPHRKLPDGPA